MISSARHRLGQLAALAVIVLPAAALAQEQARPPAPGNLDDPPTILTWVLAVILAALCFFAANIPSKRGHQD
ncbi:MAG: hypothetical protein AAGB51_05115 [Planctomycetota bacterium]